MPPPPERPEDENEDPKLRDGSPLLCCCCCCCCSQISGIKRAGEWRRGDGHTAQTASVSIHATIIRLGTCALLYVQPEEHYYRVACRFKRVTRPCMHPADYTDKFKVNKVLAHRHAIMAWQDISRGAAQNASPTLHGLGSKYALQITLAVRPRTFALDTRLADNGAAHPRRGPNERTTSPQAGVRQPKIRAALHKPPALVTCPVWRGRRWLSAPPCLEAEAVATATPCSLRSLANPADAPCSGFFR